MTALRTARQRAHDEVSAAILAKAREHLAIDGAAGLSLRAVARDLGLASSSAVYRYFENRDALLTGLIVAAYDSLGEAAEAAIVPARHRSARQRWVDAAMAVRAWAIEHPHEFALLYGTPVPGYQAPTDTIAPGTRVTRALLGVVAEAEAPEASLRPANGLPRAVGAEMRTLAANAGVDLSPPVMFAAVLAWTQLFGLLIFELFGQTTGMVHDHAAFFAASADAMATAVGL